MTWASGSAQGQTRVAHRAGPVKARVEQARVVGPTTAELETIRTGVSHEELAAALAGFGAESSGVDLAALTNSLEQHGIARATVLLAYVALGIDDIEALRGTWPAQIAGQRQLARLLLASAGWPWPRVRNALDAMPNGGLSAQEVLDP